MKDPFEEDIFEQYKGKLKLSFSDTDLILRDHSNIKMKGMRKFQRVCRRIDRKFERIEKRRKRNV